MPQETKATEVGPGCPPANNADTECPKCRATMRLWAGFYRCPNCGYKESCCFYKRAAPTLQH